MYIQLLSDLHNEFLRAGRTNPSHHWNGSIPTTKADLVVLAGDIDTGTHGVEWAISESKRLGKVILYVLGNHEFYRQEYRSLIDKIFKLCRDTNVHLLNQSYFVSEDVRFLGVTLWTDYELSAGTQDNAMLYTSQRLADHRLIRYQEDFEDTVFTPQHALSIHKQELHWLQAQLETPFVGKTVIITHHGPHLLCQHPDFSVNELSGAFHSDLDWFIEKHQVEIWMYGHSHANIDVNVHGTRIVSNQAGYPEEGVKAFRADFMVEV